MATNSFKEYSKQAKDWQQKVFKATTARFTEKRGQKSSTAPWKAALGFQKNLVNSALDAQEAGINTVLNAQQEALRGYFKLLRNNPYLQNGDENS